MPEGGLRNLSLDLIYGLPSQSKNDWADTLAKALALHPEHLSCYGLKLEPVPPLCICRFAPAAFG
jgi:oxygen-independent coproporphyrinogen-3 oxidase